MMSFEESLVWHASPTLASIKTANLYSFRFHNKVECLETIRRFNELMNEKGICIELLKYTGDFYLIYVYRKSHLQKVISDRDVKDFLKRYSYPTNNNISDHIESLRWRLKTEKDFPHEIGIFLGYPIEDVKAFIETKGCNSVLCGDWKVYHDEDTARCLFCKYKHCREMYIKVYREGRRFIDMLVSA